MIPVPDFSVSATWETTRAEAADFIEAIRPKWPRAFDIAATFADGSREVRRVLLDAPDGTTCTGVLVSGPRMANGAWSPPDVYRHAGEIDGKPVTVEIRRAER